MARSRFTIEKADNGTWVVIDVQDKPPGEIGDLVWVGMTFEATESDEAVAMIALKVEHETKH